MRPRSSWFVVLAVLLWPASGLAAVEAPASTVPERKEPKPPELSEVGITEHLNTVLPKDLPYTDSSGKKVLLGDMFDGQHPVILTMNYSNCPMLCSLQLNGLFEGLAGLDWNLGQQYRMVTVSIDPAESVERASQTKAKYLKLYRRDAPADGWRFLIGQEENIKKLAKAVGFGYVWDEKSQQYAHQAAIFVCTPDGRVSRYLYGVEYRPSTLRLALLEASEGKIGTTIDQIILYCFHYDAEAGRYAPAASRLMQIGGAVLVAALGGWLVVLWRRERRRSSGSPQKTAESVSA